MSVTITGEEDLGYIQPPLEGQTSSEVLSNAEPVVSKEVTETSNISIPHVPSTDHKLSFMKFAFDHFRQGEDRYVYYTCLLYTSPSPRDRQKSRMPSSA